MPRARCSARIGIVQTASLQCISPTPPCVRVGSLVARRSTALQAVLSVKIINATKFSFLKLDFGTKMFERELKPFCTLCKSFKSIAIIFRKEKRAQISVVKWNKKKKTKNKEWSILSNNMVPVFTTQTQLDDIFQSFVLAN